MTDAPGEREAVEVPRDALANLVRLSGAWLHTVDEERRGAYEKAFAVGTLALAAPPPPSAPELSEADARTINEALVDAVDQWQREPWRILTELVRDQLSKHGFRIVKGTR